MNQVLRVVLLDLVDLQSPYDKALKVHKWQRRALPPRPVYMKDTHQRLLGALSCRDLRWMEPLQAFHHQVCQLVDGGLVWSKVF